MSASGLPFDDIRALCSMLPPPDRSAMEAVREKNATLIKPVGSLGRLEELAQWVAGWQGSARPTVNRPLVALFAGNHGIAAALPGDPPSLTAEIVSAFAAGGGVVNQICAANDIGLKVFDLALSHPTADFTQGPALDERDCAATMAFGMEAIAGGADLLCLGDVGAGNGISAAAICLAIYGGAASDWIGFGQDEALRARRIAALDGAIALHRAHLADPLEVLRRLGGREVAAIAGAILAARLQRVPVVLDGYVVCAAAAVLHALDRSALDHCLAGHVSAEPGHRALLERLGLDPLLDLGMRLGEGTGAALAAGIVKTAVACHNDTATAEQAGFSRA